MLIEPVTATAGSGIPWWLMLAGAVAVAAVCCGAGWIAHHAHRRWPTPTKYEHEPEQ
jgi:hypothetical protein